MLSHGCEEPLEMLQLIKDQAIDDRSCLMCRNCNDEYNPSAIVFSKDHNNARVLCMKLSVVIRKEIMCCLNL